MGELIEFRKDQADVWSDSGEPPDEAPPEPPRLRLLMLPILLFLDLLAAALAILCRPLPGSIALGGAMALWVGLRDLVRLDSGWSLMVGLLIWLIAHVCGHDFDRIIRLLEEGEATVMRAVTARSARAGRLLHLVLYLYVATVPGLLLAVVTGALPLPRWVPPSLKSGLEIGTAYPWLVALGAVPLAILAVVMRQRWHPIARHATIDGRRRKLTLAA
ncbi:MAG TPA: hypothetical protein VM689_23480 [Aliidongia sp.]|nr:hypothetical protein [Aliidongia sp.]